MSDSLPRCESCGQPAVVHVTNEIGHEGAVRHYCLACAALQDRPRGRPDRRLNRGAVLILMGACVFIFSIFADQFGFGRARGFGWKQHVVMIFGLILVGAGTLVRASTVFVTGAMIASLAVLADWLRMGADRGVGTKQLAGAALGAAILAAGVFRVLPARRRSK